jgi:Glyoxalase-like domain
MRQHGCVPVGQVILGVRDLDASTRRFEALGFTVVDGGVHPGLGTANRVIPLGNAYLELLGVVDRDDAEASAFGQSLLSRISDGDRLVRWSIRTERIARVSERLGLSAERRQRRRPDGTLLTWQAAGIELSLRDAWLPFFMQWDAPGDYPGAIPVVHPVGECSLSWIEVSTPDPDRLERWIEGENDLPLRRGDGDEGIDAVGISTPHGDVVVSGDR